MIIIRCKTSHRAYVGDSYSRLAEDFMPEWGMPDDYIAALAWATIEGATEFMNWKFRYDGLSSLEVVEVPDPDGEARAAAIAANEKRLCW